MQKKIKETLENNFVCAAHKFITIAIAIACLSITAHAWAETDPAQSLKSNRKTEKAKQQFSRATLAKSPTRNIEIQSEAVQALEYTTRNIVMYSGEVITMQADNINRVAIGNGKLVSATVIEDGKKLLVIAQDVGDTNLILWRDGKQVDNIKIRVTATDTDRVMGEVKGLFAGIPEISVQKSGDRIFIDGENLSPQRLASVKSVKDQYPNVIDRTTGVPVPVRPVPPSSMLMFDVYFVEFKKNYLQSLGIAWQKSFNGVNFGVYGETTTGSLNLRPGIAGTNSSQSTPALPAVVNGISTALNVAGSLAGNINLAVNNGLATLLAAPKLAVRSGGKAKFLAGGEFPIPISGITGNTVEYKSYGILLEVNPVINDVDKTVSGTISTEVSALDPAVTVNNYPGILKRRTDTDFYSNMGQAIVLSGLYTQESSQAEDKVPLLGDLPFIGNLFKSKAEGRKNTELVVFIVPTAHSSQEKLNADVISSAKDVSFRTNSDLFGQDILPKLKLDSEIWKGHADDLTNYKDKSLKVAPLQEKKASGDLN